MFLTDIVKSLFRSGGTAKKEAKAKHLQDVNHNKIKTSFIKLHTKRIFDRMEPKIEAENFKSAWQVITRNPLSIIYLAQHE